jgi:protein involved in polysaccharide export with SLBB domain
LYGLATVLTDKPMVDRILLKGNSLVGDLSSGVAQKAFAASPDSLDHPQQIVAGYALPTVSAPPVRVAAADVAVESSVALDSEDSKTNDIQAPSAAAGVSFGVGDKLTITFYERLKVEEDKWGRATSAISGIQQRPELSGEYTVQEDGTVSVPLLGSIPVAAQSPQQVHTALDEAFENLLGRRGRVNGVVMERAPIYVLGPVKNRGSF